MDPLARSGLDYTPSATVGVGQADTGLRIAKNVMDFNVGFLNGFVNGGKSTLNFVRSLCTAQGWKNIGQGFVNFAEMANIYSVDGLMMRTQMGMAVNDYVSNIPNMSTYELGHDGGFLFEKVLEIALVSRGASLTVNAVRTGKSFVQFSSKIGRSPAGNRTFSFQMRFPKSNLNLRLDRGFRSPLKGTSKSPYLGKPYNGFNTHINIQKPGSFNYHFPLNPLKWKYYKIP
jgi:hypothetical protein